MKQRIALLIYFLLLVVLCGCAEVSGVTITELTVFQEVPLSEEMEYEFNFAWLQNTLNLPPWDEKDYAGNPLVTYWGMIGNYGVFRVSVAEPGIMGDHNVTVAGYSFSHESYFQIYICHDGKVSPLLRAYQDGVISEEQIGQIHKITQIQPK